MQDEDRHRRLVDSSRHAEGGIERIRARPLRPGRDEPQAGSWLLRQPVFPLHPLRPSFGLHGSGLQALDGDANIRSMGNAGNGVYESAEFDTALKHGDYASAVSIARRLPRIDLRSALRLTVLAAKHESRERYDAMAVRWLTRLVQEKRVDLNDVHWASSRLKDAREGLNKEAGSALERLVSERRWRMS